MELETKRLLLRNYRKKDMRDYFEYISNPNVLKFEPYLPMTKEEAEKNLAYRIKNDEFVAVELKSTHKLIGNLYLGKRGNRSLELGYVFNDGYWNQGYATESVRALIQETLNKGIHRIYAECDPLNIASWKLLERLGLEREGHFKQNVFFWRDENNQPIWKDTFVYAILNVDKPESDE